MHPDFAKSLPCWLSQDPTKKLMGPILFVEYEESLVSSNFNSNLFRFHSAHPNLHAFFIFGYLSGGLFIVLFSNLIIFQIEVFLRCLQCFHLDFSTV